MLVYIMENNGTFYKIPHLQGFFHSITRHITSHKNCKVCTGHFRKQKTFFNRPRARPGTPARRRGPPACTVPSAAPQCVGAARRPARLPVPARRPPVLKKAIGANETKKVGIPKRYEQRNGEGSDLLWEDAMKPSTLGAAMVAPSSRPPTTKPAISLPVSPSISPPSALAAP